MSSLWRKFNILLMLSGGTAIAAFAFLVAVRGAGSGTLLFLALVVPTAWVRIKVEPSVQVRLSPVLIFSSLLMLSPYDTYAVSIFSALIGGGLFARMRWNRLLAEVGEEALSVVVLILVFQRFVHSRGGNLSFNELVGFIAGVTPFVMIELLLDAAQAKGRENVRFRAFALGPGRIVLGNLFLLSLVAVGVRILASSFSQLGYFVPALAVASLIEFYYPYKLLSDQEDVMYASLAMIAQAIDAKDPYTAKHSLNVASIAVRIARVMGLDELEVREIRVGALLHDIGKVGVKGSIIRKPGRLEEHEGTAMRRHPVISAEIMRPVEFLSNAARLVKHHHEHIDGSGYPDGLHGEDIPLGSRVILVADAFDAMTTDRPYRKGRSKPEALGVLREHAGKQFDAKVVAALDSVSDLI